jgi:putative protease
MLGAAADVKVFNAQAQSGVHYLELLLSSGIKQFRVELVDEPPELVGPLLEGYLAVMEGRRSADDLWGWLRV